MNLTPEQVYKRELYKLLFFLSGHGGGDFQSTTRRDMLEGTISSLLESGLLGDEIHGEAIDLVCQQYEKHPFHKIVKECLEGMPREEDCVLGDVNAIDWVKE